MKAKILIIQLVLTSLNFNLQPSTCFAQDIHFSKYNTRLLQNHVGFNIKINLYLNIYIQSSDTVEKNKCNSIKQYYCNTIPKILLHKKNTLFQEDVDKKMLNELFDKAERQKLSEIELSKLNTIFNRWHENQMKQTVLLIE